MSYLNRFLIDEEIQFECFRVYDEDFSYNKLVPFFSMLKTISNEEPVAGHVIIAADITKYITWNRCKRVCEHPVIDSGIIISCIESERLECVTKNKAENLHNGGLVSYDSGYTFQQAHSSIGDDIEMFYQIIITERLMPNFEKPLCKESYNKDHESTVATFHLSMLSDDDEEELQVKNVMQARNNIRLHGKNHFGTTLVTHRRYPCFKFKTSISKQEQNYALSVCYRRTVIRYKGLFYHCLSDQ